MRNSIKFHGSYLKNIKRPPSLAVSKIFPNPPKSIDPFITTADIATYISNA